jgi:hypothetical protein
METTMRRLLTFLKTQNPRREGQGHAGGWLEARVWTRCHAKDPLDASAVTSFVQARFLSIVRALCTTLALGAVAFGVCSPASAQIIGGGVWGDVKPRAAPAGCTQATTFLARTSGLNGTETTAYTNLICGLVTDGIITGTMAGSGSGSAGCGSLLDALYIFATNSTTTANLNICSTSYGLTTTAAPTFTVDHGYTGDGATTFLDTTTLIPSTFGGNYSLNSASFGVYVLSSRTTAAVAGASEIGSATSFTGDQAVLRLLDTNLDTGLSSVQINDNQSTRTNFTITNVQGNYLANRSSSSAALLYRDGSPLATITNTSVSVPDVSFVFFAMHNFSGSIVDFSPDQISAGFVGGSLTPTQATAVMSRINTYMTALGINVY